MTFKQLLDLNEIERDEKGIYHSISNTDTSNQLDLVVVPGVGFKSDGYRIGYGGGFYDRFLSKFKPNTISLLYDFQLIDFKPDEHDQPVDELIIYNGHKWRQNEHKKQFWKTIYYWIRYLNYDVISREKDDQEIWLSNKKEEYSHIFKLCYLNTRNTF